MGFVFDYGGSAVSTIDGVCGVALGGGGGAKLLEKSIYECPGLTALLPLVPVHCRLYT